MIITYHKESFVKVQQGDLVVAFSPISRDFDAKATRFGADLCLISLNEPAFSGCETVTFGNKEPFILNGPGEYELDGIFVYGYPSSGALERVNTIFTTEIENIRLCHLGALANTNLDPKTIEDIGVVDILFIPVSDQNVLSAKEAAKLAASLEPKIIIPLARTEDDLKNFAKEIGGSLDNRIDKLTIKRKDLEAKEGEMIIIQAG